MWIQTRHNRSPRGGAFNGFSSLIVSEGQTNRKKNASPVFTARAPQCCQPVVTRDCVARSGARRLPSTDYPYAVLVPLGYGPPWCPEDTKFIRAMALPTKAWPGYRCWSMGLGTGLGVILLQEAKDIKVSSVTSDAQVSQSRIRFRTEGSNDVLVIIDGGDDEYPGPVRKGREGHKAILRSAKSMASRQVNLCVRERPSKSYC